MRAYLLSLMLVASLGMTVVPAHGVDPAIRRAEPADPPYSGTIFLDDDIITSADPFALRDITYTGRGQRRMFDRRVDDFRTVRAYLFRARYRGGRVTEVQVNPEFGTEKAAATQARKYAAVVGQLPRLLLRDIEEIWIHRGRQPYGGGNRSILIHTGQTALYVRDNILEETLVHEAAHTSLDEDHAASAGWLQAQAEDPTFISNYARDNPTREDIAESFLPYFAVRFRADRLDAEVVRTIEDTIPARLAYFDEQNFDYRPFVR